MTVSLAWVRKAGNREQLWFVSDSRLSGGGGRTWDHCSKILPLSRRDSAISFGGDTDTAYPLMLQCALAVDYYAPARERATDIPRLKVHTLRVFNKMAAAIKSDHHPDLKNPRAAFIFGGYSWQEHRFIIWEVFFNEGNKAFEARPARCAVYAASGDRRVVISGDKRRCRQARTSVAFAGDKGADAEGRLVQLLRDRHKISKSGERLKLDMEPFEVVRDMLRESKKGDTIGGAPQLVRIDQHVNARAVGVYWPDRDSGQATLLGRPVHDYEKLDAWLLDPATLKLHHPYFKPAEETEGSPVPEGEDDVKSE